MKIFKSHKITTGLVICGILLWLSCFAFPYSINKYIINNYEIAYAGFVFIFILPILGMVNLIISLFQKRWILIVPNLLFVFSFFFTFAIIGFV